MASRKLLITTTHGTTILDLESKVDVHLNKDIYLEKQAIYLNVGDTVRWQKEYIQKTLDEVDSFLESSPRYMHSKRRIFERNAKNEYIPLLRTELWRGILNNKGIYNRSLESIIKKEEGDFDASEYDDAIEYVSSLLDRHRIEISRGAIRKWLEGETYTPKDWGIFNAFAKINNIFKEFDGTNLELDGRHSNYKIFVVTRQTVMRYIAKIKEGGFKDTPQKIQWDKQDIFGRIPLFGRIKDTILEYLAKKVKWIESPREKREKLNIRCDKEIDIVVRSLLGEKEKGYAPAKIISIEKILLKPQLNKETREHPEHKLSRGIETKDEGGIRRKEIGEFIEDYFFVNYLFSSSLNRYIDSRYKKEFEQFSIKDEKGNIKGYAEGLKHLLLYKYNEPENYTSTGVFKRMRDLLESDDKKVEYADKVTELLLNDVFKGRLDRYFGIPQDSFKKLFEAQYQLRVARPAIFTTQEQDLDRYENGIKKMNDFIKRGGSKGNFEFARLLNGLKESHNLLMRTEKRIEEKFPLKCSKEFHGSIMLAYLKGKDNEEKPTDVERIIRDYDLEEFRDMIKGDYKELPQSQYSLFAGKLKRFFRISKF